MRINKLSILMALTLILCVGAVSAAFTATMDNPIASTVLMGSVTLKVNTSGGNHVTNCTFWASSASTANSTAKRMISATNATTTAGRLNGTFDSTFLEDASDYVFYSICDNTTATATSASVTGVVIDNTVPAAATLSPVDDTSYTAAGDEIVTFTATLTGSRTTACTLVFDGVNPGLSSYSMIHSGNTCTYSSLNMPNTQFRWYVIQTDGRNTTTSSTTDLEVDVSKVSAGAKLVLFSNQAEPTGQGLLTSEGTIDPKMVIGLVAVGAIVYMLFLKKKR